MELGGKVLIRLRLSSSRRLRLCSPMFLWGVLLFVWLRHPHSSGFQLVVFGMSMRARLDQAIPLCEHGFAPPHAMPKVSLHPGSGI